MTTTKRVPFRMKTVDDLRAEAERIGVDLPIDEDFSIFTNAITIGSVTLPNRFAVNPMEGFDADTEGTPQERSFRRYERFAAGGAPLIWFEATAVVQEGRSNAHQFWLHDKNVDTYAELLERTRRIARETQGHDILATIQLTHSGRYSKPDGKSGAVIAQHSGVLDPVTGIADDTPTITDEQLDRLQDAYVHCAKLAAKAGFDGVDVKSCHGYLLNELLGSHTREGKYGGSFENRTRFLRETVARMRNELPNTLIVSRLNVYDAIKQPWGFCSAPDDYRKHDLTEAKRLIAELEKLGMPLINITIGNPYFNPHYNRPYEQPVRGGTAYDEHPLIGVARFCAIAGEIQQEFPELPMITGGCAWLRHLVPYVAAGMLKRKMATLFGQGRGVFAYPDSVKDLLTTGKMNPKKVCTTCSGCTELMRRHQPTGCVIRDREWYKL